MDNGRYRTNVVVFEYSWIEVYGQRRLGVEGKFLPVGKFIKQVLFIFCPLDNQSDIRASIV